jgi:predicted house-cleaning noncanonical NTP pyrophosphatase (MazG superfamily)
MREFLINFYKLGIVYFLMNKRYNKLVRDKIPEIIKSKGKHPVIHTASNEEYLISLNKKLLEEVSEYKKSEKPEELADLMEVIYAIGAVLGVSEKELDEIRANKARVRGKFLDKIILEKIE